MVNVTEIIDNYVAVWNEPNADERRRRIHSVWMPDGTTCFRLLDARGYKAIEARVASSWDKWLHEGRYIFRPKNAVCHHSVVKLNFAMVNVPGDEVEAEGLCFLVLNPDGRIVHDYQFNPTANEANELVERYLAVWSNSDKEARRRQIAELWAPEGSYISETSVTKGHRAIEAEASVAFDDYVAKGFVFSSADRSQLTTIWCGSRGTRGPRTAARCRRPARTFLSSMKAAEFASTTDMTSRFRLVSTEIKGEERCVRLCS